MSLILNDMENKLGNFLFSKREYCFFYKWSNC